VEQAPQIPLEIAQWPRTRTPDLQAFGTWKILSSEIRLALFGSSNASGGWWFGCLDGWERVPW